MPSPIRFAWAAQRQALPIVLQIRSSHAILTEPRASLPLPWLHQAFQHYTHRPPTVHPGTLAVCQIWENSSRTTKDMTVFTGNTRSNFWNRSRTIKKGLQSNPGCQNMSSWMSDNTTLQRNQTSSAAFAWSAVCLTIKKKFYNLRRGHMWHDNSGNVSIVMHQCATVCKDHVSQLIWILSELIWHFKVTGFL